MPFFAVQWPSFHHLFLMLFFFFSHSSRLKGTYGWWSQTLSSSGLFEYHGKLCYLTSSFIPKFPLYLFVCLFVWTHMLFGITSCFLQQVRNNLNNNTPKHKFHCINLYWTRTQQKITNHISRVIPEQVYVLILITWYETFICISFTIIFVVQFKYILSFDPQWCSTTLHMKKNNKKKTGNVSTCLARIIGFDFFCQTLHHLRIQILNTNSLYW